MADGLGAGDIFRSRILGSGLEDTQYPQQAIGGMMGGANPQQMQAFYGSPQVQEQFRQFGIDPQQFMHIRQSPFFQNSFMQQHPMLGGALTGAMANAAATPEAPMVSGAGSGISRAMQGMFGGPEMLRQYQMHQMMAPMGMLGGMMPMYGEERRRAIEEAIVQAERTRQGLMPDQARMQQELSEARAAELAQRGQAALERAGAETERAHQPKYGQYGYETYQPGGDIQQPQGMPRELGGQLVPGGDWQYHPYGAQDVQNVHPERAATAAEKNANVQAGVPGARAQELKSRAGKEDREPVNRAGTPKDYSARYNQIEQKYGPQIQALQRAMESGQLSKELGMAQIAELNRQRDMEKANIDLQRGDPGASERGAKKSQQSGLVNPGANQGRGAQAGGPGAQQSQGTAIANPYR